MLENLIEQWLEYLELHKQYSHNTINSYRNSLKYFRRITGASKYRHITEKTVHYFRLKIGKKCKAQTQWSYLMALRGFLHYLKKKHKLDVMDHDDIELPKAEPRPIKTLNREELDALFDANKHLVKEYAVLQVLYSTGLRAHELLKLPRDVDMENGYTMEGKGGKTRLVFFNEQAKQAVREFEKRRDDKHWQMFPYKERWLRQVIKDAGRRAGIKKKLTPHIIRHTFATQMLQNGAPLHFVRDLLGHSDISTTGRYLHTTNNDLAQTHAKIMNT